MTKRNLRKAFNKFDRIKKKKDIEIPGILGFRFAGRNVVEVPNRRGYVYVRLRNNLNEVIQAYNDQVSNVYGLPVILIRDEVDRTRYKVKGKDLGVYQDWNNTPYLPRHGNQHSFNPEAGGGGDVTFIYNRQFVPLSVQPSATSGAGSVMIQPYAYYQNTQWKYAGGTGTASLLPYKPTGSNARMVLVYLDGDGNPGLEPGSTYFSSNITGNAAVLPYIPSLVGGSDIPLAGVRLVSGTNTIVWDNIYDLRPLIVSDGFIPTGTTGHEIQNDGTPLSQRAALNFVGSAFSVYNTGSETNISGSFTSDGGITERAIPIFEDGAFQVTGTIINFVDNLDVIVSGSVAHIQAQAGGAGLNVVGIFDDSVYKTSGSAISFDSNLTVVASGTTAFVSSSGGGYPPAYIYDINEPKGSADTPDDDFSAGTLDGKWVGISGSVGTVSLLRTNPAAIYDLSTISDKLCVQLGHTGTASLFDMRQDYTLPSGSSIILAVDPTFLFDTALTNDELWVGLALNGSNSTYDTEGFMTWLAVMAEAETGAGAVRVTARQGGGLVGTSASTVLLGQKLYFRILRQGGISGEGGDYHTFYSIDGNNWVYLDKLSLGSSVFDNVWVFAHSKASFSLGKPVPIQQFDWIRLGTANIRPW